MTPIPMKVWIIWVGQEPQGIRTSKVIAEHYAKGLGGIRNKRVRVTEAQVEPPALLEETL